jgi:addiction module RelB/DinJ family antitoxin
MKTMLNVKIDVDVKREIQKTAEAMGVPLGTIANILFRQFAREKEINISLAHKPSAYLIASIQEAEKEYNSGKLKSYKGTKELFKSLSI